MSDSLFNEGGPHDIRRTGQHTYTMNVSLRKMLTVELRGPARQTLVHLDILRSKQALELLEIRNWLTARIADVPQSRVTF
jgi:hypothetical protein